MRKITRTFEVETENGIDKIKVQVQSRSSVGNFIGWKGTVNGKVLFNCLYVLTAEEAIEQAFVKFVKENR